MGRGRPLDLSVPGQIFAVLGPTNTGKTHVAIERMLQHRSGMMGFPLRLLAREVYDRVVRSTSVDQVALVTGEEKIVPPGARFWICTVESMPIERTVAFLAVDEVQLAADPHRGHVFTDRLMRARGVAETWFLGSDTIAPLLQTLVPTVQIRRQPRLSRLSYAGPRKITTLPPRAAAVAFGVQQVYALAERLRARHGGAAVVHGALSPRTRNAQVELFQSGAVAHIVATDAIGMGLNMDLHHVALAGSQKFDGRTFRPLRADELAQVVGRAGRWTRDGTFGETAGLDPLHAEVVDAIEQHAFAPLRHLWWRNPELDFMSVDTLLESFEATPPRRFLRRVRDGDDVRALRRLVEERSIRDRAKGEANTRLLWDVCRVPDFGGVGPEQHATLLGDIFGRLQDGHGELDAAWYDAQLERLDRTDGDISALTARIARVRIWTFVSHRPDWLADPRAASARARDVEDRLSDALHERLTARFVDRRASRIVAVAPGDDVVPVLQPGGGVEIEGVRLGVLKGLSFELEGGQTASAPVLRAVRRLVTPLVAERLQALLDSPDGAFSVRGDGEVVWDDARVARLVKGDDWRRPKVRAVRLDWLDGAARGRLTSRLELWRNAFLQDLVAPLDPEAFKDPAARGLVYELRRTLGVVRREAVADLVDALTPGAKKRLKARGVRLGRTWVLHRSIAGRDVARAALWRVAHPDHPGLPADGIVAPVRRGMPRAMREALGFESVDGWLVRVDVLEAVAFGAPLPEGLVVEPALVRAIRGANKPKRGRRGRGGGGRGPRSKAASSSRW